ncbi:MAG: hypothetical protein AB9900_10860 [Humidesulfovibrio sp.]
MGAAAHHLTPDDRAGWLQRHAFDCPVYRAKLTPQACAANRMRPLKSECAVDDFGASGGKQPLLRNPGCGEDCPTWAAQRDKNTVKPAKNGVDACGYCKRVNMSSPARGLCGSCNKLALKGDIVKTAGGLWMAVDQAHAHGLLAEAAEPWPFKAPDCPGVPLGVSFDQGVYHNSEPMPGQAPPVIVHGDKLPPLSQVLLADAQKDNPVLPTMMGTDPADALIDTELAQIDLSGQTDLEGWEFYDPRDKPLAPAVWITKDGHLCINADAVGLYKLGDHTHARLGLHKSLGKVCIMPTYEGHGALALQRGKDRGCQYISGRGFLARLGLSPVRNKPFPITSGPGGMLVFSIETQAEEAMKEAV